MSAPSILSAVKKIRLLLTRQEKFNLLGIIGFALCTSLFEVLTASIIVIFAQVLNFPSSGKKYLTMIGITQDLTPGQVVLYFALTVGGIYLVKNLIAAAESFYQNFSIQKMNYHFKNKLLNRYAEADYGFSLTRNSSLGLQVVGGDAEHLFSNGLVSLAGMFSEGIVFTCLMALVISMNPSLALFILVIGILLGIFITKILLPRFYSYGQKLQHASLSSTQNLIQFFHGFKEIVLLGKREVFINAFDVHSAKKSRVQALQSAINTLPRMVIEILFVSLFVSTIAILCLDQESPIQMIGTLGGYLYAGFRLMPGLNRIINQLNVFKSSIPSVERVYDEYTSIAAKENYAAVPDFDFNSHLELKGVCYRYLNTDQDALQGVNLHINKGECIGIVGETGSGKSTLVDIILGLLKPYEGKAVVDGNFPVNSYQWHKKIGYVPQSIYLTDDTIEANIAFGEQVIDQARLNDAINAAQLRKFIAKLPQGVQTFVGERGIRLSGGERQRIAIARALYHSPEVLIFDEATSALDNATEARLMETIQAIRQNRTVIMVAHRLTTLKDCERIVVMEKGQIKIIMTYEMLMEKNK